MSQNMGDQHPSQTETPAPISIGCNEATEQRRESKIEDRMGAHIRRENPLWNKMMNLA